MPGAEGNPGKTVSNKENNNDLIQQTKGKQRNYGTPEESERDQNVVIMLHLYLSS